MWNERFASSQPAYGTEPSLYLRANTTLPHLAATALVPGDGGGRNGVWLAEQGFRVLSVDYSKEGLARALDLAASRGVEIETELADLTTWSWPVGQYDLIASIYVHMPSRDRQRIHRSMLGALKPGGKLVLEAFHTDQLNYTSGGPKDQDMLMTEERLRDDFRDATIVDFRHEIVDLDESDLHRGPASLVRMLVQRS